MKNIFAIIIFLISSNVILGFTHNFNHIDLVETDTIEIKTINYTKSLPDSSAFINIYYPQIKNMDNTLVENKINSFLSDEFQQSIMWYDELIADTVEMTSNINGVSYSFETGFEVKYNSKTFLSISLDHYQFTGGAHGNYYSLGYNIRLNDGKVLTLEDIINESSFDLLSYECEQAFIDTFHVTSLLDAGLFEDEINILPDQDFYIIPGALVLQFDPYEIAPYAMGELEVRIPFDRIKDILKENLPFSTK